tara:strand:+ start:1007 stop:1963 length:957 start_codon:yes stop_codon:yes gene_type:complete
MQTLQQYCRSFKGANGEWPPLPLAATAHEFWWRNWLEQHQHGCAWDALSLELPQLLIKPAPEARQSDTYKRLVLRGETLAPEVIHAAPKLKDPGGVSLGMAEHPCGALPVMTFPNHDDFVLALRCLAHRCEPVSINSSVHAQAVTGLIHWGLIRHLGRNQRCQLLMLHEAPYSSLPHTCVRGNVTPGEWVKKSMQWRLTHELTHIACQKLVGEMRINLFDELIADALGMLDALHYFSADLFRLGLGLTSEGKLRDDARAHVYLKKLEPQSHFAVCKMVLLRAAELEFLLAQGAVENEPMKLLRFLTSNRLDQPLRGRF